MTSKGPRLTERRPALRPWERPDFAARPSFGINLDGAVGRPLAAGEASLGWAVFDSGRIEASGSLPLTEGTSSEQKVAEAVTTIDLVRRQQRARASDEVALFTYDDRTFARSVPAAEGMTLDAHRRQVEAVAQELRRRGLKVKLRPAT